MNDAARSAGADVYRNVPYAHVRSVERSLEFYGLLGFAAQSVFRTPIGEAVWALARSEGVVGGGGAEMMLARASGPVDAGAQAVLFYMNSRDVAGLRERLVAAGVRDRGAFTGKESGAGPAAFAIGRPHHMPAGELRLHDPDGYVILVGQIG